MHLVRKTLCGFIEKKTKMISSKTHRYRSRKFYNRIYLIVAFYNLKSLIRLQFHCCIALTSSNLLTKNQAILLFVLDANVVVMKGFVAAFHAAIVK